jgi:hypothetical protein
MVVQNTTAYTWNWYCHLVGDRASLKDFFFKTFFCLQSCKTFYGRNSWMGEIS